VIQEFDFDGLQHLSVTEAFQVFLSKHTKVFNFYLPLKSKTIVVKNFNFPLSEGTKQLIIHRDKLYQFQKTCRNPVNTKRLQILNKLVRKSKENDKKSVISDMIQKEGLWNVKNKLFPKKSQQSLSHTYNPQELNEYFSKVSNDPVTIDMPSKPKNIESSNSFKLKEISKRDMIKCYAKLKNRSRKTEDITGLAPIMLAKTIQCPLVSDKLQQIINMSIKQCEFPTIFKTSLITPIPKVENPQQFSDFRPVAGQPFASLLLEKCVYAQATEFMENNNLFYQGQFGFRSSHSCETAMAALLEYIYQHLNKGNICLLASLDLAKAFDTIVREFLLEKLEWYGIDSKWFRSYLSYRCQIVKGKNGEHAEAKFTGRGCPQGSGLGTFIFSVYINDLPSVVKHCMCILFADDTQLCVGGSPKQIDVLLRKLESDIECVIDWMSKNGMKLNASKTQLILLGSANNVAKLGQVSIDVDGITISSQETLKSLGLVIDAKLTWEAQINKISKSYHYIARSLYPFRKLCSTEQFIVIAQACLLSLIQPMIMVWGSATKKAIAVIERCIRQTARVVLEKKKFDRVKFDIYKTLMWMLPHDMFKYKLGCFTYKVLNMKSIPYFNTFYTCNKQIHSHATRNANEIRVTNKISNNYGKMSLLYQSASMWNNIPDEVKQCKTLKLFRTKLKKLILDNVDV